MTLHPIAKREKAYLDRELGCRIGPYFFAYVRYPAHDHMVSGMPRVTRLEAVDEARKWIEKATV